MNPSNSIIFTKETPVNVTISRLDTSFNHWNDYLELLLVLQGSCSIKGEFGLSSLLEEDIIVLNCNEAYEITSSDAIVVSIKINISFFSDMLKPQFYISCNSSLTNSKSSFDGIKHHVAKLVHATMNLEKSSQLELLSLSCSLLHELSQKYQLPKNSVKPSTGKALNHLKSITEYIQQNYADNISLQTVSDREYLSPTYIAHLFEKNMGMSFYTYLTRIRLLQAVRDLLTSDLTNEQIAQNHGFSNYRYFVSSFKKQYNMLPKDYRKAYHQSSEGGAAKKGLNSLTSEQFDFMNTLGRYLNKEYGVTAKKNMPYTSGPQRLEVKCATSHKRLLHKFRTFISVAKAHDLLMEKVQAELCEIQYEVGFEFIKFHGLLDDTMQLYFEDKDGNPKLSFTYVDEVMDFILSIGLKPLVELSFMPSKLAENASRTTYHIPSVISSPSANRKWVILVTDLTNHFIARYGLPEVRSWMFSFWSLPFGNSDYSFESEEVLWRLYRLSYEAVKECDLKLRFGFPSCNFHETVLRSYQRMLDFAKENHCYPDFYNLLCFPLRSSAQKSKANSLKEFTSSVSTASYTYLLSDDPDYMKHFIETVRKELSPYRKLPLYLTEWGPSFSHIDWLNDTCYRSAYIVKNILENYDLLDSFSPWCLSDTMGELPPRDEEFHGELGMFTIHRIKKPAYYAYVFLRQLFQNFISSGEHYFITRNEAGSIRMLLYNYIHISPMYADGVLFNVTYSDRYNAFSNPAICPVDLNLTGVQDGHYRITEEIVNQEHGSAFDQWLKAGLGEICRREEVEALKNASKPMKLFRSAEAAGDCLNYQADLMPHEIRLVTIDLISK